MPEVTSYQPGSFCWVELTTSDDDAAKQFYTSLFGWGVSESPMGEGQPPYIMLQKGGKNVGAMYENKSGAPPNWLSYIAVRSADETAEKVKSAGGNVAAPPFDVMDVGRMAVIQDPQGATFAIWEAKKHFGAEVRDEANTLCWNELMTSDIVASRSFYESVFGWTLKVSPEYTEIHLGDHGIGGMLQITPDMQGTPTNWLPYFWVDDCDGMAEKAKSLGAAIYVPPTNIPNVGRFSVIADPQGAVFEIVKLG